MSIKPRDQLVIASGAIIIIVLVIITVNELSPDTESPAMRKTKDSKRVDKGSQQDESKSIPIYEVEYKVDCVGCDISYTNETGGTDILNNIMKPWSKKITVKGDEFLYLSAQNGSTPIRPVTVTIKVNGIQIETETSNGKFAIADVSCYPIEVHTH